MQHSGFTDTKFTVYYNMQPCLDQYFLNTIEGDNLSFKVKTFKQTVVFDWCM